MIAPFTGWPAAVPNYSRLPRLLRKAPMSLMPGAQYVGPIPASNYANNGGTKIGTATHVIVGSAASALGEFKSPNIQLSAHFIIVGPGEQWPDGHILQVLDTDLDCYAQAAGNYAPTAYIAKEFAGNVGYPMSAAQLESSAQIDAWAASIYHFPLQGPVAHGQPGLIAHCNPDGSPDPRYGDHVCPGLIRLAQISGVASRARQIAGQSPPAPPTPPHIQESNMIARNTQGVGYWCVRPSGAVYAFNGAPALGPAQHFLTSWGIGTPACPVVGIADDGHGGFTLMADANQYPGQPALYGITADGKYKV